MNIGFTGTQKGMTDAQKQGVRRLLWMQTEAITAHHGDCIGADADFHKACLSMGIETIIHPPINESKRAFCNGSKILPAKEYLDRNHDIVDACELLIATPFEVNEQLRSGTWATIRYARKKDKKIVIIKPNGEFK